MIGFHFFCSKCAVIAEEPCEHWQQQEIIRLLKEEMRFNRHALLEILHDIKLLINRPQSATLNLQVNQPGEPDMPATIQVGKTANSLFQEWTGPNGTGTVVPNAGAVAFTSDNPAVATVDPASGVATGVSVGSCNISGTDPANNLTASDSLTVTAATAVSATLTLTAV